jgi:RNA processing factor Prp31
MREKVSFIRVTESQDSTGQLINSEIIYYQPKGVSVKQISGSVDMIIQQQNIISLIEIEMRYNPEISIINGDKIEWRGFRFNALSPIVDPLRRYIKIKAFSEIESTNRTGEPNTDINWDGGSPGSNYDFSVDGGSI